MPRGNEQTLFRLALQFVSCRAIVGQNGETIHVGMNGVPLFHTWNQLDWHVYLAFDRVGVYLEGSFCFGHFIGFSEFAQQVIHIGCIHRSDPDSIYIHHVKIFIGDILVQLNVNKVR